MKKKKQGFTMIEIMIAAGIIVVAVTLVGSGFQSLFSSQKNIEAKDDATNFSGSISEYLYRDDACSTGLLGSPISSIPAQITIPAIPPSSSSAASSSPAPVYYQGFGVNGTTTPIAAGLAIGNSLRIASLTIVSKPGVPISSVNSGGVTYEKHVALIEMLLETKTGSTWSPIAPRTVEIPVYVQGGIIKRCKLETSLQEACEAVGGTFDSSTGVCTPQKVCSVMGAYMSVTCSVAGYCAQPMGNQTLGGAVACPPEATPTLVGTSTNSFVVSSGGKKGDSSFSVTQTLNYYMCMRCN